MNLVNVLQLEIIKNLEPNPMGCGTATPLSTGPMLQKVLLRHFHASGTGTSLTLGPASLNVGLRKQMMNAEDEYYQQRMMETDGGNGCSPKEMEDECPEVLSTTSQRPLSR